MDENTKIPPPDPAAPPLAGLRVLDFSRVLAGPFLTQILASLGADVVKVEAPGGDPTRALGEPEVAGASYYFHGTNGGKRSLVLDLRTESGAALAKDLAARADAVVENFRPGTMDRLGLAPAELLRSNPRLVVLSISGLGADAEPSERAQPSFDLTIQARAGAMSINGQPGGAPTRLGIPTGDLAGALFGCIGILASLLRRERTGAGQIVDASLLESQLFLLGTWISLASLGGAAPEPAGSAHPSAMPYDAYEAADGFFVVAVFTDRFWPPFAEAIGRADLAANVNYATGPERVRRRADLDAILRPLFRSKPRADWIAQFRERGIPAEPVATIPEALADPVLRARGMLRSSSGSPALARIAFPAKFDGAAFFPNDAPAALGSARDAVLAEWLGLSRSEIGRLEQRGAFGPHPGSQHAPPPAAG